MTFLSVLIVFILVQWWGSGAPLHHDKWFFNWQRWLHGVGAQMPVALRLMLIIIGPALVLLLVLVLIADIAPWLQLLVAVPLLLYCLGRGKYTARVSAYHKAREQGDWDSALINYEKMREHCACDADEPSFTPAQQEWPRLHHAMLVATAYRGFERMFTVLFWFVAFGPVGALVYRISSLLLEADETCADDSTQALASHWLWVLEWPVVRVLSLSFALTGNFVSGMQSVKDYLIDTELSSRGVLHHSIYGALNLEEDEDLPEQGLSRVFKACLSLLSRTLILWICVLAVVTLW